MFGLTAAEHVGFTPGWFLDRWNIAAFVIGILAASSLPVFLSGKLKKQIPETILQYGERSKTDGIVQAFQEKTDVPVISPKEELIKGKEKYETYSVFGDPTHWTHRGAHLGYLKLMEEINRNEQSSYYVLKEDDYHITTTNQGMYIYGSIHKENLLERFELKDPKAKLTPVGDSYFYYYILDDIAESFHETIFLWGDHQEDFKEIIDGYAPDILIIENAEREDRSGILIQTAEKLNLH